MYIMETNERTTGFIKAELIEEGEIMEIGDNSEFVLVYYPNYKGASTPVFWAKRLKGSIILFSYESKEEVELVKLEELRRLVFVTEGEKYNFKWSQWAKAIESNLVDTNSVVKGMIVELGTKKVVRVIPPRDMSEEALYSRLCKGFPTKDSAKRFVRAFGYKLEPLNE